MFITWIFTETVHKSTFKKGPCGGFYSNFFYLQMLHAFRKQICVGASSTPNVTHKLDFFPTNFVWLNLNLATLSQLLVGFWKTDVLIYLWLEPTDCVLNAENGCRALFWDHQLFIFSVCSASSAELWLSTSRTVAAGNRSSHWRTSLVMYTGPFRWHGTTPRALARVGALLLCQAG